LIASVEMLHMNMYLFCTQGVVLKE